MTWFDCGGEVHEDRDPGPRTFQPRDDGAAFRTKLALGFLLAGGIDDDRIVLRLRNAPPKDVVQFAARVRGDAASYVHELNEALALTAGKRDEAAPPRE